jgi:hypothetical protein
MIPQPYELLPAMRTRVLEALAAEHPDIYELAYKSATAGMSGLDRAADAVTRARGGEAPVHVRGYA